LQQILGKKVQGRVGKMKITFGQNGFSSLRGGEEIKREISIHGLLRIGRRLLEIYRDIR
jgi:hypothetical protein